MLLQTGFFLLFSSAVLQSAIHEAEEAIVSRSISKKHLTRSPTWEAAPHNIVVVHAALPVLKILVVLLF